MVYEEYLKQNDNYIIEKQFMLNQLDSIKKDILNYMTASNFRQVKYDILNSVNLVIDELKKYKLIKE